MFPELKYLACFKSKLQSIPFEMNVEHLTITCECPKDLLQEAIVLNKARVIQHEGQGSPLVQ